MNFYKVLIILCLVLSPILLTGIDFNLNNYEVPDYTDQDLKFGLNSDGNLFTYSKNSSDNLSSYFDAFYDYEKKFNNNYLDLYSYLSYEYNYDENDFWKTDSLKFDETEQYTDFYLAASLKYYLSGDIFAKIMPSFSAGLYGNDYDKDTSGSIEKDENSSEFLEEGIDLSIGYGKINNVSNACKALYILTELESNALLTRTVTQEDVTLFANKLFQIDKIDLFDSRLDRIEKLKQINSVLFEMGLMVKDNIDSYVIISDLFELETPFYRYSGWQIYPEFSYRNSDSNHENKSEEEYFDYSDLYKYDYDREYDREYNLLSCNFEYNRIFDRDWQLSFFSQIMKSEHNAETDYTVVNSYNSNADTTKYSGDFELDKLGFSSQLHVTKYIGTRTILNNYLNYSYSDSEERSYSDEYDDKLGYVLQNFIAHSSVDYFISPALDVELYAEYHLKDIKYDDSNQYIPYFTEFWGWVFGLKINYQIF